MLAHLGTGLRRDLAVRIRFGLWRRQPCFAKSNIGQTGVSRPIKLLVKTKN